MDESLTASTSTDITKLDAALLAFQSECPPVPRDAANSHFGNRYATLGAIQEHIKPYLSAQGITVVQLAYPNPDGAHVVTMLRHAGQWLRDGGIFVPVAKKADPQAFASAMTYARRNGLCAVLGLSTEDDDNGNGAATPAAVSASAQKTGGVASATPPTQHPVTDGYTWPFPAKFDGAPEKGTPLEDVPTKSLEYLAAREVEQGTKWTADNLARQAECLRIIAERNGGAVEQMAEAFAATTHDDGIPF